jgi:pilus assembly protein CpaF
VSVVDARPPPDVHGVRVGTVAREVHQALVAEVAGSEGSAGLLAPASVAECIRRHDPLLGSHLVGEAVDVVLAHAGGLGRLDPLLADDAVAEIMVNGDGSVWLERAGRVMRTGMWMDSTEVLGVVERVLAPLGLKVDQRHPVADGRLADGSRVHVVLPPVSVDGPCLTIRRFRVAAVPVAAFAGPDVALLLDDIVARRCNIVVSGGTGAGKTTLLNALAAGIDPHHRVVTIEDTAELRLPGDHVVRLEARPAGAEGSGRIGIDDLVRTALRMRPDRIVVGEVRGPEALAMLGAMNTGHDGSLSTLHANSAPDALRRLEAMVMASATGLPLMAVRDHLAAAVDVIVHVARSVGDTRSVVAVDEVVRSGTHGQPVTTRSLVDDGVVVAAPTRWRRVDAGANR